MTTKTYKVLNGEHVKAMVKALETAGIRVKHGELGGFFVKAKLKATGDTRTVFSAILVARDTYAVSHDADLFEPQGGQP